MSFSTDVKQELSKLSNLANKECVKAEMYGYLNSNNVSTENEKIKFKTENDYNIKVRELEENFNTKYNNLLDENIYLNKIINKFLETLEKFIHWICKKFVISEEDNLIGDFPKETNTFINPEKQIEYELEKETDELSL